MGTLCFFDNETGEKVGELHNIESLDLSLKTEEDNNDERIINFSKQRTFTGTFDAKVLRLRIPVYVQVRTHHKKRINKKWLKRYGMKLVLVDVKA